MFVRHANATLVRFAILAMGWSAIALAGDVVEPRGEISLAQAVAAALAGNPDLQHGELELQMAAARIVQAGVRPNPDIALAFENFAGSGSARGTDIMESTLTLSQVVEFGGKRSSRLAVANAQRDAALVDREVQQLDVLSELTRRFIDVVAKQEAVTLAARVTALAADTSGAITRRVEAARSPKAEQNRATIEAKRAQLDQQRAENELRRARVSLAAMWGSTTPQFESAHADLYSVPKISTFENLLERVESNPDIRRLAAEGRVREAQLRLQQVQRVPSVTFGAGVRRLQETGDSALVANLSIPLPVFDRNQGNVREAAAKQSQLAFEARKAHVEVHSALFELYQEFQATQAEATALRETIVPQAEQALSQTEYGYQRGRFSYLELLNAQREVVESQRSTIDTAANIHRLAAEIERLTGTPLASEPE